jgi:subtilisin family serine protease
MRAPRPSLFLVLALAAGAIAPSGVTAADPALPHATGDEVLVRYRADVTAAQRRAVTRDLGLTVVSTSATGRTEVVLGGGVSSATVRRRLAADPRVVAVSANYQRELDADPTDEAFFNYEWGLHNTGQVPPGASTTGVADVDIDGLEALRVTLGLPEIVVAVIDDGVDFDHPDLADRAWDNPTPAGAGTHGWDFCDGDSDPSPGDGNDDHGTHVAGTISASLNGTGVVGVAPAVKIMALRAFSDSASCNGDVAIINAIDYAASFGVPIINASWGGPDPNPVMDLAIADSGALFVASAGNQGLNLDASGNNTFPAESAAANVITVAAIDHRGGRASFSNYGATAVDIGAPGTNIVSTITGNQFGIFSGTSMAAPHVAGVAALAASVATFPSATVLKAFLMNRGVTLASMAGRTVSGRLVNALRVVDMTGPTALPVYRHAINTGTIVGSSLSATVSWPAATDDHTGVSSYVVRRRIGTGSWTTIANTVTARSLRVSMAFSTSTQFAVAGRDGAGNVGTQADSPAVKATLFQDGTSLARYSGRWSATSSSTASHGNLRTSTQAGAWVEFKRDARAIAIVGRQGPTSGKARVYVDGVYVQTIDLYRSTSRSRMVLFSRSWSIPGVHSIKLIVSGTSGRPRVDIDAFPVIR